jgi:hypothetical protein
VEVGGEDEARSNKGMAVARSEIPDEGAASAGTGAVKAGRGCPS